jgi:hypothetical protein
MDRMFRCAIHWNVKKPSGRPADQKRRCVTISGLEHAGAPPPDEPLGDEREGTEVHASNPSGGGKHQLRDQPARILGSTQGAGSNAWADHPRGGRVSGAAGPHGIDPGETK